jgi:hypothetical protein
VRAGEGSGEEDHVLLADIDFRILYEGEGGEVGEE